MQKNAMAEKKKVLWEGIEIPGLVSVGDIILEKSTIEIPSFHRIRQIQSGITKIPAIELVYSISRDTNTRKFWESFYLDDETHDGVIIRTDATGTEFARKLLPGCECIKLGEAAYDAAAPKYAQLMIAVIPWDIILIEAE